MSCKIRKGKKKTTKYPPSCVIYVLHSQWNSSKLVSPQTSVLRTTTSCKDNKGSYIIIKLTRLLEYVSETNDFWYQNNLKQKYLMGKDYYATFSLSYLHGTKTDKRLQNIVYNPSQRGNTCISLERLIWLPKLQESMQKEGDRGSGRQNKFLLLNANKQNCPPFAH